MGDVGRMYLAATVHICGTLCTSKPWPVYDYEDHNDNKNKYNIIQE